jgi:HEAT repeat protein
LKNVVYVTILLLIFNFMCSCRGESDNQTKSPESLVQKLGSDRDDIVTGAEIELRKLGKNSVPCLIKGLTSDNKVIRQKSAYLLGDAGDVSAVEPLILALKDSEANVRGEAASALGWLHNQKSIDPLLETLKDKDEYVRSRSAFSLGKIGNKKALEPLIKTLQDKSQIVRKETVIALGLLGDVKSVPALIRILDDKDPEVRTKAASSLGQLGDKKALEPLMKKVAMKHETREVRIEAICALGLLKDKKAIPVLLVSLKDADGTIRAWSSDSIARIGDKKLLPELEKAIKIEKTPEVKVRLQASIVLLKKSGK